MAHTGASDRWANSGSCPTTPASKRIMEAPITAQKEAQLLVDFLLGQGWQHVGQDTFLKWYTLEDGTFYALTLVVSSLHTSSTSGATPSNAGMKPVRKPAPRRAKR